MRPALASLLINSAGSQRRWFTSLKSKSALKAPKSPVVQDEYLPMVTIIGKPNVGKSRLFNRLIQRATALVKDTPDSHVTRDYRQGRGRLGDLHFQVTDTSGFEAEQADTIQSRATQLTLAVLKRSDAAIFLIDARNGLSTADEELAHWLKASLDKPVVLVANKAEARRQGVQAALSDATRLGLGLPVAISAATGDGMVDLYAELQPIIDNISQQKLAQIEEEAAEQAAGEQDKQIKLAIVGLPNAGKSTLMNQLLGRARSLTGPESGLTRDAVADTLRFSGHELILVDTAGWLDRAKLRKATLEEDITAGAQAQAERCFNQAHVVLLVVDATVASKQQLGLRRSELALASSVVEEGRALVIILNKVDAVPAEERLKVEAIVESKVQQQLPEVRGAPCLPLSALTGEGADAVLPAVLHAYTVWNQRITTAKLNKWLVKVVERYTSDGSGGGVASQIARVRYVTQVSARPPSFVAFLSGTSDFSQPSLKFLGNALRQEFGFDGVPLRMDVRTRKRGKPAVVRETPSLQRRRPVKEAKLRARGIA